MSGIVDQSANARSKTIGQNFRVRAWVNFDGTGTIAIRDSGNISGLTDNGTGDYTVNFTTDMPDTNYAVSHSAADDSDQAQGRMNYDCTLAANSYRFKGTMNTGNSLLDSKDNTVIVVR